MDLVLREHQESSVAALREGFRAGHRTQLLYAPTGAGKTECAIYIMKATSDNYKRAAMILDRIVLVDQTSNRLFKYKIGHGVFQANHWNLNTSERIQVCSAQTLERRNQELETDLLIIDECHCSRAKINEIIENNPDLKVIGLTATPFTKGLSSLYSNVVCATTTADLVEKKLLVPLRVFIAKEIDMTGATKVAGEWSAEQVTERGMKITGDIVAEWIKKTHEIFGGPRKTIVFCAGVDHGKDLSEQFAAKGYNFVSISYKDDDEYKRQVLEDFERADTEIHGVIATDILTKGFDSPDVMIGISARPFSKSLSSHIQQMGRVMRACEGKEFALWLCMAKGSKVLTDHGLVDIDKVKITHKIWDGTNFVNHGGAVCNGIQEVITYQGLTATEGHFVHTAEGWRTFGYCAKKQIRITQTGFGGQAIRLSKDIRSTSFLVGSKAAKIYSRFVRMCNVWIQKFNFFDESAKRENKRVSHVQPAVTSLSNVAIQQSSSNASAMLLSGEQQLPFLWWSWSGIQIQWGKRRNSMDHGKSWNSRIFNGDGAFSNSIGQNRSIWTLRAWKPKMDFCGAKSAKQARKSSGSKDAQVQNRAPRDSVCRQHLNSLILGWINGRANSGALSQTINKTKREVWDILDCGPNNRFTCEGLLVHNCHSGNYLRFEKKWDDVYENGVTSLDNKEEKAVKEPTEKEKKESKCPACSALWPKGSDSCASCGYVRQRKSIESVAGEMVELKSGKKVSFSERQAFYSELLHIAHTQNYNPNWASHKYKNKFGVWPNGLDKTMIPPSLATKNWVKRATIAWVKGRQKGAA